VQLNDNQFSRREFMKLMGAGTLFLGLGAFGISNLKNIREASVITEATSPINNINTTRNDMGIQGSSRHYSCCKILISFPNGSRIKNLRTPHGSL
jgi:hypothetical protein